MNKLFSRLTFGSIIITAIIFGGCGGGGVTTDTKANIQENKQPHKVTRVLDYDADHADDWQNFVDIKASFDDDDNNFILDITFNEGITTDVAHFQIYLNTDNDRYTGYNDGTVKGAEYLIEDGSLFKSTSNTEWEWEYIDEVYYVSEELDDGKHHILIDDNGAASVLHDGNGYLKVSIEPVSEEWTDTHNFVEEHKIKVSYKVKRVKSIEGYQVPRVLDYSIHNWHTKFIDILNNEAYALSTYGGNVTSVSYKYGGYLSLLDVTDIQNPILQSQLDLEGYPRDMYTEENFSYVVVDNRDYHKSITRNELKIVDTTDKENPHIISSKYLFSNSIYSILKIKKDGNILTISNDSREIIIDVSDPANPVIQ
jgi:hypothetical protein